MELVPIKVKIGLRPNGHADHPDWSKLPMAAHEDPDAHTRHAGSWKYDKTSGHKEASADSPLGMQWGAMLVTPEFAVEALTTFPETISKMTELEWETFYNVKAHGHLPENRCDVDVLVGLKAERDLRKILDHNTDALDIRIAKALDPDDPEPGLRKDRLKTWADAKILMDHTIQKP